MNRVILTLLSSSLLAIANAGTDEEAAFKHIVQQIEQTQTAIESKTSGKTNDYHFIAVWDFDGTILKGDCTEGLTREGTLIYKGLAQLSIESGFSSIYSSVSGPADFASDYHHMEKTIGRWLAYPYVPQMLRGSDAAASQPPVAQAL